MIVPIDLPAGAYRNGTEYQSKGRWRDVNLVRWDEGAMRPVGGWSAFSSNYTPSTRIRGALAWRDNSGNPWCIFGGHTNVLVSDVDGVVYDIEPTLTDGIEDATSSERASTWSFGAFGEIPIACRNNDGKIWEWDLNTANNLTQVTNSPTSVGGIVVTDERFIFALADGGDTRSIRWCDRDDRTTWTAAATNQAGGYDLPTDGEILFGLQMRGEVLIVTTTDAYRAVYVGYPDVWSFSRIGDTTAVGRLCGVRVNEQAYWWGGGVFWVYDSGYVRQLPCPVSDYVFSDVLDAQVSKITAWHNAEFSEVWWLYESTASTADVDRYVAFNYAERTWHYGKIGASTIVGPGPFDNPLGFHPTDVIVTFNSELTWNHGTNWQGTSSLSQTSPTASSTSASVNGLTVGQYYLVDIDISGRTAGTLTATIGSATINMSGNTTYTESFVATSTSMTITYTADGTWDGTVTNTAVRAVGLMYHESGNYYVSPDIGSQTPSAKTGPLDIGDGERRVHVTKLYPDEQDQGELDFTFTTREYPTASETTHGPYTAANPTSVRFSGRQFTMKVEPNTANTDWRCGVQRLEIKQGGKR